MTRKEEIKQQISKLQNELDAINKSEKETLTENYHINHKHCIVCQNRIKELDFRIPDGIVCNHPSNQTGKNKYKYCHHTCEHWTQETN